MPGSAVGLLYALSAALTWGLVVPVHFRLLAAVPPERILAHRIVWATVFVTGLLVLLRARLRNPFPLRARHALLVVSAALIALNWLFYLHAVATGRILDASLGYFITPLVGVALGRIVLGERLRPVQALAVAIAATGVVLAIAVAGRLPVVSLTLAVSFALYGLIRKVVGVDAIIGFSAETILMLPFALGFLALVPAPGPSLDAAHWALLVLTGATTALPLIWYAAGAQRLTLATLGLVQYVAPTCLMLLSTLVFDERLTMDRAVMFTLIWIALALYGVDSYRAGRQAGPRVGAVPARRE